MWTLVCSKDWYWFTFVLVNTFHICNGYRACLISQDPIYTGKLLDCSNIGISAADIFKLGSLNVSTLIISNNDIKTLQNKAFLHLPRLKRLECVSCNLNVLEANALYGLNSLEVLFLNHNFLKIADRAFPFGFFHNVPRLKILDIGKNKNHRYASNYSEYIDIFYSLHELAELTIDSFSNLRIGVEFTKLKTLSRLRIICDNLINIDDNSLLGFDASSVQQFSMYGDTHNHYNNEKCDMLFNHLPNISSLMLVDMIFGHKLFLKMLMPIKDRKLDLLYLDNIGLHDTMENKKTRIDDRFISGEMLYYLKDMCITHMVWLRNYAIYFGFAELFSIKWRNCLKTITFVTEEPYLPVADLIDVFCFLRLKKIERIILAGQLKDYEGEFWEQFPDYPKSHSISYMKEFSTSKVNFQHFEISKNNCLQNVNETFSLETNEKHNIENKNTDLPPFYRKYIVSVPPFLKHLVIDNTHSFHISRDLNFTNNSLRSLTARSSFYGSTIQDRYLGLDHLEEIDFTNSRISGNPTFFKWFPSLKKLVMRKTQGSSSHLVKVAENVPKLEYFDIAENNLQWLPIDMFRFNGNLKYLCLASNRLARIPFVPKLTPKLEILDLRENFLILTLKERQSFDDHYYFNHVANFTIFLNDNHFSCACSAMHFFKWIQHSRLSLDKDKDYICMTEEGSLSHISNYSDVESFWRQCSGQTYFLWSLIIFLALIVFYLTTFLVIMRRTQIISKIWQIMMPKKCKEHFTYDVVIGYAAQDWRFIKMVLLPYLEDSWNLRVFVHQRDMLQDPLMMSHAIRDSWRTLLVITEDFLYHCDMAHNFMKVCTFFVNPTNPNSVIVIVEQKVQNRIPDYVLQVVDEDNIIVLAALPDAILDYNTKETLKTRIFDN